MEFGKILVRLEYLLKTKGIGLFTGSSGMGKTYSIKYFVDHLNVGLYKPIYLCLSTITVLDFYKNLCIGLGITPAHRKLDMFKQIQETIKTYVKDRKITPVIILDERMTNYQCYCYGIVAIYNILNGTLPLTSDNFYGELFYFES